jgi:hypothetical protein
VAGDEDEEDDEDDTAAMADTYAPVVIPSGSFRATRPLPFRDVVFMSSWYRSPVPARDPELRLCFWLNSHNAAFTRRIWFVDPADAAEAKAAAARGEIAGDIQVLPDAARGRLRFGDAFRMARDRFPENAVLILANSDIAIPAATASLLASLAAVPRVALCLTRHESAIPPAASRKLAAELSRLAAPEAWAAVTRRTHLMDSRRGSRSQDVWVWHSSLRPSLARLDAIPLGKPGCDNAIAHHLSHDARARLLNPCHAAKTYHIHASAVRGYTAKDRIPPPYAGVPFAILPGDPGHPGAAAAWPPPPPRTRAAAKPAPAPAAAKPALFVSRRTSPIYSAASLKKRRDVIQREQGPIFIGYV